MTAVYTHYVSTDKLGNYQQNPWDLLKQICLVILCFTSHLTTLINNQEWLGLNSCPLVAGIVTRLFKIFDDQNLESCLKWNLMLPLSLITILTGVNPQPGHPYQSSYLLHQPPPHGAGNIIAQESQCRLRKPQLRQAQCFPVCFMSFLHEFDGLLVDLTVFGKAYRYFASDETAPMRRCTLHFYQGGSGCSFKCLHIPL